MPPLIRSLRPRQWLKNAVVFAGLVFSGQALQDASLVAVGLAFVRFCMISSAVYLFNDVLDRERDRHHPQKKNRPIASGVVSVPLALATSAIFAIVALSAGAFYIEPGAGMFSGRVPGATAAIGLYLLLQIGYTLKLKHVVLLDVFCIAAGFLLRVLAGAWALGVVISPWLIACTVQIALFLALCKRRAEVAASDADKIKQRPILSDYPEEVTTMLIGIMATTTLVTYTLYTLLPWQAVGEAGEAIAQGAGGKSGMVWTIPFVLYGLMRYLFLVFRRDQGQRPELIATLDGPMIATCLGWAGVVGWVLY